ncbi:hypothetical protein Tco_0471378 [Tanacetum coccineum]
MSSPNHPTSDIEDAFSSNFPDYIPASPDYFPASPGNTSSESSNNSSGLVPIASPTLSLFHNDTYMKVMQAYDAISPPQVTIPPLTVVPPSSVLSQPPMFDSRDFFPLEEIPPPKDTETPIESPILISSSSSAAIKKLVADSVATALEAQAATMSSTSNPNRNTRPIGTLVTKTGNYKEFISCQPFYFNGTEGAVVLIRWKIEDEFYNLTIKGDDLKSYIRRFQELAVLCPNMVPNTEKLIEAFIVGLPRSIEGNVTASKPQTLEEAINITQRLMDQVTRHNSVQGTNDHKRKFDDRRTFNNNNYQNDRNNNNDNHNNDHHQQQNRRQETFKAYAATPTENHGGCQVFIAQVMEKKSDEKKRLEDIPVVREFPEVFPEDLPGLPSVRQELSNQLQELADRGFIQPSTSPWGAPVLFVKKKTDLSECVSIAGS